MLACDMGCYEIVELLLGIEYVNKDASGIYLVCHISLDSPCVYVCVGACIYVCEFVNSVCQYVFVSFNKTVQQYGFYGSCCQKSYRHSETVDIQSCEY